MNKKIIGITVGTTLNPKKLAEVQWEDVQGKPTIPSKTSELTNDSNFLTEVPSEYVTEDELAAKKYLTSYTETDPTVPSWAKQEKKPTYTASEVGAEPANAVSGHNVASDAHNDIRLIITDIINRLNALANSTDIELDQMAEVVAYIKDNRELIEQVTTGKVSIADIINNLTTNVSNKPLSAAQGVALKALIDELEVALNGKVSTGDFTNHTGNTVMHVTATEKQTWNNKSNFSGSYTDLSNKPTIPSKTSQLTNDSNFITDDAVPNISYGTCSTVAATAAKEVTVADENWNLVVGSVVMVEFAASNSASNVTLNVNGTGAYPIWYNNAEYTSTGTAYTGYANRVIGYVFNGTHWVWLMQSYDSNTTYTNVKLGHGYATCSTAAATVAKVGTLSSYTLTTGGIVAVKFTNAVPASATLNINSKGAKAIYYRGAAITAGVIKAGDTATFIYNGSQYHLLAIDTPKTEEWTFTLEDGSTVTKKVVLA